MSSRPKVSIIIPVYNTSKYLTECLDSVINQTLQDIEIICVDDGSIDNSLEILNQYAQKDSRVQVLTQNHKKQGAARNLGMSIANGEYIGFVDSDDWCELDMFEKLYQRAKETDSDITMCGGNTLKNYVKIQNDDYSLKIFPESCFKEGFNPEITIDFLLKISVSPVVKIYKYDLINNNNIKFPTDIYYEDASFFIEVWLTAKRISLLNEFCYNYRLDSETSTCYRNDLAKLDIVKFINHKKRVLKKYKIYNKLKTCFKESSYRFIESNIGLIYDNNIKKRYIFLIFIQFPIFTIKILLKNIKHSLSKLIAELNVIFYIHRLKNFNNKIAFWGASIYLEKLIKKYHIKNKNVVGIIDKDRKKWGKEIGNYTIYPPEQIGNLNIDVIICTIINNNKKCYPQIQDFLRNQYPNIILKNGWLINDIKRG